MNLFAGAAIFVFVCLAELGLLSEFRGGGTKRGRASKKCLKKAGRFPYLQLGRLVSEASGTHHKQGIIEYVRNVASDALEGSVGEREGEGGSRLLYSKGQTMKMCQFTLFQY